MRVLFVHPGFPGPFRSLAAGFGSHPNARVIFVAERVEGERIPGVRCLLMSELGPVENSDSAEREMVTALRRGAHVAKVLLHLYKEGFRPDMVCTSSSSGCGLYVADIFPDAFRVVYADWFHTRGAFYRYVGRNPGQAQQAEAPWRMRNLCQYNALVDAHFTFTPTEWQKVQFPACFTPHIQVLAQGVDSEFFAPPAAQVPFGLLLPELEGAQEIITFSGRSLEAYRGFPQFVKSLPRILAERPGCHALIMETERDEGGSGIEQPEPSALAALSEEQHRRVHYLGMRPRAEYRRLLRTSSLHVYLTAPYALSDGLLEAMSCGCLVLGSDTEPVREVLRHGVNGFLCPFSSTEVAVRGMGNMVMNLLARAADNDPAIDAVRAAARQTVLERFDSTRLIPGQIAQLMQASRIPPAARTCCYV